ncbi:MAG: hypothetical protein KH334_08945, partial [Clostridiales bacterium]|nr:hypothetical protein [Clostridiales bacterium]
MENSLIYGAAFFEIWYIVGVKENKRYIKKRTNANFFAFFVQKPLHSRGFYHGLQIAQGSFPSSSAFSL